MPTAERRPHRGARALAPEGRHHSSRARRRSSCRWLSCRRDSRLATESGDPICGVLDEIRGSISWSQGRCRQDLALYGCCRNRKQTTPDDNGDRSSCEYPVVSIAALLRLASWSGNFRASSQGGSPCHGQLTPLSPPAFSGASNTDRPDEALGGHPSGEAASVAPNPQPDHRPATLVTAFQEGGGA
jgi:hypothetical protein